MCLGFAPTFSTLMALLSINRVTLVKTCKNMNRKLKRTLPYLRLLKDAPARNRRKMLRSYPSFVVDDLVEIIYNIMLSNVRLHCPKHYNTLHRNSSSLVKISDAAKSKKLRKQLVYQQSGGFIGAILPLVTSVLGGLVSSAL